jgi:hypothetical protein
MSDDPIRFGPLLRHLRETAGVLRDEAAKIAGLDSRKYDEIERMKGREWPCTKEGLDGYLALMRHLDADRFILPLWTVRMRQRKNFSYRFSDLTPDLQMKLSLWELEHRFRPGNKPEDSLPYYAKEILSRVPTAIPDSV